MEKARYNCAQAVFIVLVETVLSSLEEYRPAIEDEIPKYDEAWIQNLRDMLTAAIALPTEEEAQAVSTEIGVKLADQNRLCCELWQKLSRRIQGAFPANVVKIKLSAAGQAKYRMASGGNWSEAKALFEAGKKFMAANLATLTANGNMNPNFQTKYEAEAKLFNSILTNYQNSKEAIGVATQKRVKAFNAIFDPLIDMMEDVQGIYRYDEAVRTQFTFSHVLERISGPGLAGARGTITNGVDSMPIENAMVKIWIESSPATFYTATTDADGKYLMNCPSGDYKLKVTAENYVDSAEKDISISVGTVSAFDIALVPLVVG